MPEFSTLENCPHATNTRWDVGFVALLSLGGLASGVLTSVFNESSFSFLLGAPFGVILACCLATRMGRRFWKAAFLIPLTVIAFFVSWFLAFGVEYFLQILLSWSLSSGKENFPHHISLFVGGMAGGFIILTGTLLLTGPKMSLGRLTRKAVLWSSLSGILGPIGWAMGPSLGMWIWSGFRDRGLTPPTETFSNALHGDTSHQFALYIVWQAGTAFAMGIALLSSRTNSSQKE